MRSSLTPSKVTRKGHVALGCRRLRLDDQMVMVEFAVMNTGIDFCPADGSTTTLSPRRFCCYHHWYVIGNMEAQDLNCQFRNGYLISCTAKCGLSRKLQGSKFFTISSQILTLPMEAVLFETEPFSNKFYGALERQVRDQVQHKYFLLASEHGVVVKAPANSPVSCTREAMIE